MVPHYLVEVPLTSRLAPRRRRRYYRTALKQISRPALKKRDLGSVPAQVPSLTSGTISRAGKDEQKGQWWCWSDKPSTPFMSSPACSRRSAIHCSSGTTPRPIGGSAWGGRCRFPEPHTRCWRKEVIERWSGGDRAAVVSPEWRATPWGVLTPFDGWSARPRPDPAVRGT